MRRYKLQWMRIGILGKKPFSRCILPSFRMSWFRRKPSWGSSLCFDRLISLVLRRPNLVEPNRGKQPFIRSAQLRKFHLEKGKPLK